MNDLFRQYTVGLISRVAVDMDIHGYIHVWISDLGCTMDISVDSTSFQLNCHITSVISIVLEDYWVRRVAHKAAYENIALGDEKVRLFPVCVWEKVQKLNGTFVDFC